MELVEKLLNAGADPNAVNSYGYAPHQASRGGHAGAAIAPLEGDADPNLADRDGRTPLDWAVRDGHAALVTALLAAGAAPNAIDKNGLTPLYWAAKDGYTEIVTLLLAAKADADALDSNGHPPLHWAARNGHIAREPRPMATTDMSNLTAASKRDCATHGGRTRLEESWQPRA